MADFTALKTAIQTYIKQNGNEEITGNILQEVLLAMVQTMGDGAINGLVTALSNEVTARQNADGTLQTNINNEATTRGNADTALGNRLTVVEGAIMTINTMLGEGYVYAGIATTSTNPGTPTGKVFYIATAAGTYTNFSGIELTQGINILKYNGSAWSSEQVLAIDNFPTAGSHNLVESGGVRKTIYGLTFGPGTSNCTLVSGNKYLLKNTGTVAYNVGYYYNETSATIANLKIGESIEFTSPYNVSQIWVSSITGSKLSVFDLNDASYKIEIVYEKASIVDNIASSLYDGAINPGQVVKYKMISGHTYCFKNTGTAAGSVYYRVSSSSEDVGIAVVAVGNTIEFIATVDSEYLTISSVSGFSIEVYEKGSIFEAIKINKENIDKNSNDIYSIEHDLHSYIVIPRSLLPYKMINGHTYCFRNIGTAFGGVYYRVTAEGAYIGIGTVQVGQTIEFTATENSNFLETSSITGLAIEVYEKGSTYQKLMGSEKPFIIKVCSYNLGDFSGEGLVTPSDAGSLAYRKLIGSLGANIIGTQEDMLYYGGDSGMSSGESVRDVIFGMYKNYYRYGNTQYNFKAFASDYTITDIQQVNYTDDTFAHPWFLKGIINSDILVVSLHFDWQDITRRRKQINQLISYCSDYDKVILIGDTNPSNRVNGEQVDPAIPEIHAEDWAYFTNAGYTMANGGLFGDFGTCAELVGGVVEFRPYDNIFVKGGFIREVEVITADYMNDHKPIIATVVF